MEHIEKRYSIKDLEKLSGIKAHTIRMWEKRFGINKPDRTATRIRTYKDSELKKILNIAMLNRNGLKISKAARLSDHELATKVNAVMQQNTSENNIIEKMVMTMIDFDNVAFEKMINRSVMGIGFEETMSKIINPFLNRIGVLWQTGSILAAQEHFVSNIIRQKIVAAIENYTGRPDPAGKKVILMLPDNEWHELGLLYCYYILKKEGYHVVYLGQSVPVDNIPAVVSITNADAVVMSMVTGLQKKKFILRLNEVIGKLPNVKFIASGNYAHAIAPLLYKSVIKINPNDQLHDVLPKLLKM